jgi:hypothetical protein
MSHFQTWGIPQQSKMGWVFKHLFNATLNCDFLFIRLLRFDDRLLKVLMPAQYALFENMKGWQVVYECVFMA